MDTGSHVPNCTKSYCTSAHLGVKKRFGTYTGIFCDRLYWYSLIGTVLVQFIWSGLVLIYFCTVWYSLSDKI